MIAVNELIAQLDAVHGKNWHVYRSSLDLWIVAIPRESCPQMRGAVEGDTFEDAIRNAIAWRDLPAIPRRPHPVGQIVPVKDGSKWRLRTASGEDRGGNIKTKAEATKCAERQMQFVSAAIDAWDTLFGVIASGTEGVDFRFGGEFNPTAAISAVTAAPAAPTEGRVP